MSRKEAATPGVGEYGHMVVMGHLGEFNCSVMNFGAKPMGVPRRQPHRRSGLANLPSVGAVP